MKGVRVNIRIVGCAVLLLAGCVSSERTRLPTLSYGDPRAERRSFDVHDPYPEQRSGPMVERPREMDVQRSEPRRAIEHYVNPTSGSLAPEASRYPASVIP
ncbi:MAG: hypothetical protein EXS05_00505 [Planctomycetaceae bacterium]|nr:hypothetical protein [Planctomycetaceae bacterium]